MKIKILKPVTCEDVTLEPGEIHNAMCAVSPYTHRPAYEVQVNNTYIIVFPYECEVIE